MKCGLLGRKLSHSYSPQIHAYLGSYSYNLYEKEPEEIGTFLKTAPFTGLNVTIPYKKSVIPFCENLSEAAKKLGAVNTIIRQPDGSLIGHNTDYYGFLSTLNKTGLSVAKKKVLVLGSGGASVTAVSVLTELGANVITISRTGENNYNNLDRHVDTSLIVNATPVGMYPNTNESPVSLDCFPVLEGVIDMIYNPARTGLLQQAEDRKLVSENGLWMLIAQAKESAQWFSGNEIPAETIPYIYKKLNINMQNLILIGMPGSGKTTVGKILASLTGREFIDADIYLETHANMSIPQIFSKYGENYFRQLETQCLSELGKLSGKIIATGGGCVTRRENYPFLHQNGTLIWLKRDITSLATEGRPLSQTGKLANMYQIRKPLYEAFSDFSVENQNDPNKTAMQILSNLQMEV